MHAYTVHISDNVTISHRLITETVGVYVNKNCPSYAPAVILGKLLICGQTRESTTRWAKMGSSLE